LALFISSLPRCLPPFLVITSSSPPLLLYIVCMYSRLINYAIKPMAQLYCIEVISCIFLAAKGADFHLSSCQFHYYLIASPVINLHKSPPL
jgi:hypothetical protein